jgi:hypothetical protein
LSSAATADSAETTATTARLVATTERTRKNWIIIFSHRDHRSFMHSPPAVDPWLGGDPIAHLL